MTESRQASQPIGHIFEVYALLMRFGVGRKYRGFEQCAHAVYLSAETPERMTLVTKWLYPDVAKQFGVSWHVVEHNLRTVTRIAWEDNRPLLEQLAGEEIPKIPSSSKFVRILAYYFLRSGDRAA